nr:immunoglobulin heavy chain junction region [Macaca mulatta]
CSESGNFPFYW